MDDLKMKINVGDLPEIICSCGNKFWLQAMTLRKLSKLLNPKGEDGVIPIPDMVCSKCGKSVYEIEEVEDDPNKPRLKLVK